MHFLSTKSSTFRFCRLFIDKIFFVDKKVLLTKKKFCRQKNKIVDQKFVDKKKKCRQNHRLSDFVDSLSTKNNNFRQKFCRQKKKCRQKNKNVDKKIKMSTKSNFCRQKFPKLKILPLQAFWALVSLYLAHSFRHKLSINILQYFYRHWPSWR